MRIAVLVYALTAVSCDPVNKITVAFPVEPTVNVTAYFVRTYEGRSYADTRLFKGDVTTAEFTVTRSECCGRAAAYRDGDLGFIACVAKAGADPVLVCGHPGDRPDKLVRSTRPGTTCDALEQEILRADIVPATCTLKPTTPAAP